MDRREARRSRIGLTVAAWLAAGLAVPSLLGQTPPAERPPAEKPAEQPTPDRKEAPKVEPSKAPAEPTDPSKEDSLRDASVKRVIESQQARPATPPIVAPTRPSVQPLSPTDAKGAPAPASSGPGAIPGIPKDDPSLPARRFYTEGTFLSKRAGKLVRATTGDVVFVPARDTKGRGEAPMILLPSQALARLEAAPDAFAVTTTAVLSGEVYVYYDRQYLLPTVYSLDRKSGETAGAKPAPAKPATTEPTKTSDIADPAVADLIRELETKRGSAKASDGTATTKRDETGANTPSTTAGASRQDAIAERSGVMTEGSVLFNKRARLVRVSAGPLMVAFDGDTKSPSSTPMVLLRCRMTQKLDELATSRGDDLVVQVSGRVFVYGGRNYILPTLAQVVPTGDVKTLQ